MTIEDITNHGYPIDVKSVYPGLNKNLHQFFATESKF